jgi:hypothetical protein
MAFFGGLIPVKLIGSTYSKYDSIQERVLNSYLEFVFYDGVNTAVPKRKILPFLGDVSISETRKANYIDYTPISRNSSIPFYTGSESRMFKLSYEVSPNFLLQNPGFVSYIRGFNPPTPGTASPGDDSDPRASFFPQRNKQGFPNFDRTHGTKRVSERGVQSDELSDEQLVYAFIDEQVNLIRSSVINNAVEPTKGPPIVRLNHGLMYQNIPCVCKDYSIEQVFDDSNKKNFHAKYKVSKHKVQLSISLQEIRTGNYLLTPFNPNDPESKDNIVGWEQITGGHKSLDPISPIYR